MTKQFFSAFMSLLPSTRWFLLKRWMLRLCGATVGDGARIAGSPRILGRGSLTIGDDTWVGPRCTFYVPKGASIEIGARCDIAPEACFQTGTHQIGSKERRAGTGETRDIVVGAGTWIGVRAILLGGAKLGEGTIVAAGAVVLGREYPPGVLLAGVPARVVRNLGE